MEPHDGPCGIDDVLGAVPIGERMPDPEARTSFLDGDAAHGPSVPSLAHGIARGLTDLTEV
jgi:hypothetical protein